MIQLLAFTGLPIPLVPKAILLIITFAAADRMWGDDRSFKGEKAAILLATFGCGLMTGGLALSAVGLLWFAYRSVPIGDANTDWRKAIIRHGLILPFVGALAIWSTESLLQVVVAFAAYASVAVALAARYGAEEREGVADIKAGRTTGEALNLHLQAFNGKYVEIPRGAAFGLATAVAFVLVIGGRGS